MTIRAVLACDGEWPKGVACRQAAPVGEASSGVTARRIANKSFSWTSVWDGEKVADYCESCTKRHAEKRIPPPRSASDRPHLEVIE